MSAAKFIESLDWLGLVDRDLTIRCLLLGGMLVCEIFIFSTLIGISSKIRSEEKQEKGKNR